MSLLHMLSAITAARRVSMFLFPSSRTRATMALLDRGKPCESKLRNQGGHHLSFITVLPFSSSAKLPKALADANWPAATVSLQRAHLELCAAERTCDVVCFTALHEHGDSAHVQQLRARLHVKREVCECSGGADGDAATADFEMGGLEELGEEAIANAEFVPDGSCACVKTLSDNKRDCRRQILARKEVFYHVR
jgi:hypothetical protein